MNAVKSEQDDTTTPNDAAHEEAHADYYRQLRARVSSWADKANPAYREYLLLVPDLFHFMCRLMLDKRVNPKDKAVLGLAMAYVIGPFGLIPNIIPGLGLVDDLIVMVMAFDSVLKRVPAAVVEEHWAGDADLFVVIKDTLAKADNWVGKGLFARLKKMAQEQGFWPDSAVDDVMNTAKEAASRASAAASAAAAAARSAMGQAEARPKTPSRRPGQAGGAESTEPTDTPKKPATSKAKKPAPARKKAAKKSSKAKPAKKSTKKAATKTVAKSTKKKEAGTKKEAKRTIAAKGPKKTKNS